MAFTPTDSALGRDKARDSNLLLTGDFGHNVIISQADQAIFKNATAGKAGADVDKYLPPASSFFGNSDAGALAPAVVAASDTAGHSGGSTGEVGGFAVANAQSFNLYDRPVPTTVGLDTKVAVPDSSGDAGNSAMGRDTGHSAIHLGTDNIDPVEPARPIDSTPNPAHHPGVHPLHLSPRVEMG